MSEATEKDGKDRKKADKPKKKSWFKGLKAEFKKVIWPDRKTVSKQTFAVVLTSIALGIIIKIMDIILSFGIDMLISL